MSSAVAPLHIFENEVLLVVRVIMGLVMIYYGWPKVKDLKSNANDFVGMGFKPGWFWGTIVALVEFVGGVLVLLGVYVWAIGGLVVVHMAAGTVWKVTKTKKPFTDWSYDLLLLAIGLFFLTFGGGAYHVLRVL